MTIANPFKRHLTASPPARRGTIESARRAPPSPFDPETMRLVADRRIALRFGLSLPVAAVVAGLSGFGPQDGGRR